MGDLKGSGQAVGAEILTRVVDFAPTTIASQAARLQPAQRFFNLVVTNVPGPQFPLFVLGREMESIFPLVPLARRQALCVGIMSYNGQVDFGLVGDYDAMADLDSFGLDLEGAIAELTGEPARAGEPGSADQPRRDAERRAVGQVGPVEPPGAEAGRPGVGVDQHRGDAIEAPRPRQAHRHPAAAPSEARTRTTRPWRSLPTCPPAPARRRCPAAPSPRRRARARLRA